MRIHGEKLINRRDNITNHKDYKLYYNDIKQDFHDLCGYCGKNEVITRKKFQLDHFVPRKIDNNRINDYYNIVFSCSKCNRNKWDHWPTEDKDKPHNNDVGFVDPATKDFDKHLIRSDDGGIIPTTTVGKYMFSIFKFNIRPISSVWKVMILHEKRKELNNYIDDCEKLDMLDKLCEFREISNEIEELLDYLFEKGE